MNAPTGTEEFGNPYSAEALALVGRVGVVVSAQPTIDSRRCRTVTVEVDDVHVDWRLHDFTPIRSTSCPDGWVVPENEFACAPVVCGAFAHVEHDHCVCDARRTGNPDEGSGCCPRGSGWRMREGHCAPLVGPDRAEAALALQRAEPAVRQCRHLDGDSWEFAVHATFSANGTLTQIMPRRARDVTPFIECVRRTLGAIRLTPFRGPPIEVTHVYRID